jgi:hypothetical protein
MNLTEITSATKILNLEIRLRAQDSGPGQYTHQFIAHGDREELGFLAADLREDIEAFVLYEVFVPISLRERGIGSELLRTAEAIAKKLGFGRVFVYPQAFEERSSSGRHRRTAELVEWYKRRGYLPRPDCEGELFKRLRADADGRIHL